MLIAQNVCLKNKNWFATGGAAHYFAAPTTAHECTQALLFAQEKHLPLFVLGQGANILVSDSGFNGLVIHPQLTSITANPTHASNVLVTAGAGASMADLISWCLDHQILGLEEFSGIPGSVGGSVYINLHYYQFLISHFLQSALVMDCTTGHITAVSNDWFAFGYNQSRLLAKKHLLLEATFMLRSGSDLEIAYARGRRAEIIRHRAARYPTSNTCGSFFRNFHEDELSVMSTGKKLIYVAYYLDNVGVKGALSVGDAAVSHQHANMIVNRGNATSNDIVTLARQMQQRVHDRFGIMPQPECQLIGFDQYPLL